ncbi:putative nuclease HARBI1 [Amyelois transitella]|uniref:putative nuclease HARBI1 n=1 Tax=Amyelois transitella TaxID=680683 RepID=UPI0029905BCF|nr:putative nuclease HARBI1 [Amyelois transitella]
MANEYEIFEYLEEEDDHEDSVRRKQAAKERHRRLRDQCDPFEIYTDAQFVKEYRLTKTLARDLCEEIRPFLKTPQKATDLSVETKVLTALSFFATGSYQRPTGKIQGHFVAQQTVSTVINEISKCLNNTYFREKYIHFPNNSDEQNKIKTRFHNKFNIPGVLGCIDGTHVAIERPNQHEDRYFCRKDYHSLNVQLVCDADMQIISVDASHGGATHDSFIWSSHPLKDYMEELSNNENVWFLGDSGYPLRRYMMTPVLNAAPNTPEAHYTNLHVHTRNIIERTIGLLKARFRCLLLHRRLHYQPEVAGSIVNSCVILHNMCNGAKLPPQELTTEERQEESRLVAIYSAHSSIPVTEGGRGNVALQQGVAVRNALIQRLWERR